MMMEAWTSDDSSLPFALRSRPIDRNAATPGPALRALARLDGGAPGRLVRMLPSGAALKVAHTVARGLPIDPLVAAGPGAPLDVLIPCHPKDLRTARIAVASVEQHLAASLRDLTVVMPDGTEAPTWLRRGAARVRHDGDLLDQAFPRGSADRAAIVDGFRAQMSLKWAAPLASRRPTLVLDADTILLRPRTWLVDGVQILDHRAKHQPRFDGHTGSFLGERERRLPSFVTHHQVVQPDILLEVLGGTTESGPRPGTLARWLEARGRWSPSEYQVYGALAVVRHRDRIRPTRWANTTFKVHQLGEGILPPADISDEGARAILAELAAALPTSTSVTFHQRTGR